LKTLCPLNIGKEIEMNKPDFTPDASMSTIDQKICYAHDLHISDGRSLKTTTLRDIARKVLQPVALPKNEAPWFILSTLRSREASAQAERGHYVGVALDFDEVSDYQVLLDCLETKLGTMVYLAYSTKSATKDNQRLRVVIPFDAPIDGQTYKRFVECFYDDLKADGFEPDECVKKIAQVSFMPNSGEFYEWVIHDGYNKNCGEPTLNPDELDLDFNEAMLFNPLELYAARIERESDQDKIDDQLEKIVARQRRTLAKERKQPDMQSPIDWFNAITPIDELLTSHGYDRQGDKFRHPQSESKSFSGVVFDNSPAPSRYFTLSTRDKLYAEDQSRDAFDVFTILQFGGDRQAAIKDVAAQMRSINRTQSPSEPSQQPTEVPTCDLTIKAFDAVSELPKREFIEVNNCKIYSRGFLTLLGGAGGTGKSALSIVEELSIATGYDLFDPERKPLECGALNVWTMCLEDDESEHRRRVMAAAQYYNVDLKQLEGRYFVTYRNDSPVTLVRSTGHSATVVTPQSDQIKRIIKQHNIALLVADPFVNTHEVNENDNGAMNRVVSEWRAIGQETNCAIGLTHHLRKTNGMGEVSVDDLRGAGSLKDAARIARIVANPTKEEAERDLQVHPDRRRFYFWANPGGKPNIAPPSVGRVWYEMKSVELPNGDNVGVATRFVLPQALDGVTGDDVNRLISLLQNADDDFLRDHCRYHHAAEKSGNWINQFIAERVLSKPMDVSDPGQRVKVSKIVNAWLQAKVLVKKSVKKDNRHACDCLVLGSGAVSKTTDFADDLGVDFE
jgi:hypothetical protein